MKLTHWIFPWLLALTFGLVASPARGQQPSFNDSRDVVRASAEIPGGASAPGVVVPVAIRVKVNGGWHIWTEESQARSVPGASVFDGAIFSTLSGQPAAGNTNTPGEFPLSLIGAKWPLPVGAQFQFGQTKETLAVYEGEFVVFAAIQVDKNAKDGSYPITLGLNFQACNATSCLAPADIEISVSLAVNASAVVPPAQGVFQQFDPDPFLKGSNTVEPGSTGVVFDFFGSSFSVAPQGAGFLLLLLVSFLGGMLLNFTPCVLPIIPLKIMSLRQGSGNRRRCFTLGVAMSLGVVGFWLSLGLIVGGASGFSAANQLFQYPAFTIAIGLFIAVMAVGMAGFFSVGLPAWVYAIEPKHDSFVGAFLFGVMTAVLSTPCTAPLMGAAAGWAASSGDTFTVLIVFGCIGAGMATPYFILSAMPQLVSHMPRTGAASDLVKQVMGILLLAAALFFIGAGVNGFLPTPTHAHWPLIGAVGAFAGAWLLWRTWRITKKPVFRLVFTAVSIVIIALSVSITTSLGGAGRHPWIPYSSAELAKAKAQKKTIVLDFTAEWCLNCKALESAVLHSDEVVNALSQDNVAAIKVDITSRKSDGWNLLHQYKRVSIPLLVVEGPDGKIALISDAYTRSQVAQAIDSATGQVQAAEAKPDPARNN